MSEEELSRQTVALLKQRIPMTQWQKDFPKLRIVGHAAGALMQMIFDSGFRRASILFGFNLLKPGKPDIRKPIVIQRVELITILTRAKL